MVPQLYQIRYYQSYPGILYGNTGLEYPGILYRHTGLEYPGISYWLRLLRSACEDYPGTMSAYLSRLSRYFCLSCWPCLPRYLDVAY